MPQRNYVIWMNFCDVSVSFYIKRQSCRILASPHRQSHEDIERIVRQGHFEGRFAPGSGPFSNHWQVQL